MLNKYRSRSIVITMMFIVAMTCLPRNSAASSKSSVLPAKSPSKFELVRFEEQGDSPHLSQRSLESSTGVPSAKPYMAEVPELVEERTAFYLRNTDERVQTGSYVADLDVIAAPTLWYRFVAKQSGTLVVGLCDSHFDTVLRIYDQKQVISRDCKPLAYSDDACGYQSMADIHVEQEHVYFIRVEGYAGIGGEGSVSIEFDPDVPSSACYGLSDDLEAPDVTKSGSTTTAAIGVLPSEFSLSSFPNPFNPLTRLEFSLTVEQVISLKIFNVRGQLVRVLAEGNFKAGNHMVTFNGADYPSGMYFARLQATGLESVTRLMLIK